MVLPRMGIRTGTFEEILGVHSVSEGDLKIGLQKLAHSRGENELGNIVGRRKTCQEIADLCEGDGKIENAIAAWSAWQKYCAGIDDPRHKTMAETFERELAELGE